MALTMIWYLTDGNERTGATWIVPGSHRDHRNPRGPHDGMTVSAPIPGELQAVGSVDAVLDAELRQGPTTAHHSFLSSFSAISKRNFGTKYAFYSNFQNLQN